MLKALWKNQINTRNYLKPVKSIHISTLGKYVNTNNKRFLHFFPDFPDSLKSNSMIFPLISKFSDFSLILLLLKQFPDFSLISLIGGHPVNIYSRLSLLSLSLERDRLRSARKKKVSNL